jgi:hypothetical protein
LHLLNIKYGEKRLPGKYFQHSLTRSLLKRHKENAPNLQDEKEFQQSKPVNSNSLRMTCSGTKRQRTLLKSGSPLLSQGILQVNEN